MLLMCCLHWCSMAWFLRSLKTLEVGQALLVTRNGRTQDGAATSQRRPWLRATANASLRLETASLLYKPETWVFTVFSETNRLAAMSA